MTHNANPPVEQSGKVTPSHAAAWVTDGVIADAGPFNILPALSSTLLFPTRVSAAATIIGVLIQQLQTMGYTTAGDGGGAIYVRTTGSTTGGFQSADGAWWQLASLDVVNVKQFGAKGDWNPNTLTGTDDTAAINAALSVSNYVVLPSNPLTFGYLVSSPITVGEDQTFIGESTSYSINPASILVASTNNPWSANRGVVETNGYTANNNALFWHGGRFENINIVMMNGTSANRPDFGFALLNAGEQSMIRRISIHQCKKANLLLAGFHAVGQLEDCSVWLSDQYGVQMTDNPRGAGAGSGGSFRFFGLSGDGNTTAHIYADGSQQVDCPGLKSESAGLGNLVVLLVDGTGTGNNRQSWELSGFRWDAGLTAGTKDFVKIIGTASPHIRIGPGAMYSGTNIIHDTVSGVTIPISGEIGFSLEYDLFKSYQVRARNAQFPGQVLFKSDSGQDATAKIATAGTHFNPSYGNATDDANYNMLSLNGTQTFAAGLGLFGGSNTDPNLYIIGPTGCLVQVWVNNALGPLQVSDLYTTNTNFFIRTAVTLGNAAAGQTATLANAPVVGNPTKWIAIDDNGVTRHIPAW